MTKKTLAFILMLSCLYAHTAIADPQSIVVNVTTVGTGWGGEAAYIQTDVPIPSSCGNRDAAIPVGAPQYKENLAIAMTAMASGHRLLIWYDGCFNSDAKVISLGMIN